ncbi:hypothetical protein [Streptococcus sp. FT1-106]
MTKELTQTQVEELKQALKDKNNAPHHRKIQADFTSIKPQIFCLG